MRLSLFPVNQPHHGYVHLNGNIGTKRHHRMERGAYSHTRGLARSCQLGKQNRAWVVLRMAQEGKIAGPAMLFAGPALTGKTAIVLGMEQSLSSDYDRSYRSIFVINVKTEALTQAFRRSTAASASAYKEEAGLIEGQVVEFRSIGVLVTKPVKLTIKTTDMETI